MTSPTTLSTQAGSRVASMIPAWPETVQNVHRLNGRIHSIQPFTIGGQALIYFAVLDDSTPVALKTFRVTTNEQHNNSNIKRLNRQVVIWSRLEHPYLLPFYGVYLENINRNLELPYLVSPYQSNGTIMQYMTGNPHIGLPEKLKILEQAAHALTYMHKQGVVHGDLKGANILVSDRGDALLCDFGTSCICEAKGFTTDNIMHTVRWAAKEVLFEQTCTYESDIWSLGMTILEVLTGEYPYSEFRHFFPVVHAIENGHHPSRPTTNAITDEIWESLTCCWDSEPDSRPDSSSIAHMLRRARHQAHLSVAFCDRSVKRP